jgi:hypothetical protein
MPPRDAVIGLLALVAILTSHWWAPLLTDHAPPPIRHWPRRDVCGLCNRPWSRRHTCPPEPEPLLRAQLTRPARHALGPRHWDQP